MTIPATVKTWQYHLNGGPYVPNNSGNQVGPMLFAIKSALIGFALSPWTILYSCDSVNAGSAGDLVDRWVTSANIIWDTAAAARSWIVLKQTGIAANFQLLIDCAGATGNGSTIQCYGSTAAGFTGGTTTARPTATDEMQISGGAWTVSNPWTPSTAGARGHIVHVWQSTDGQCTRFAILNSGIFETFGIIDVPQNPITGWGTPWFGIIFGGNTDVVTYGSTVFFKGVTATTSQSMRFRPAAATATINFSTEGGQANGFVGNQTNVFLSGINKEWPCTPLGLVSELVGTRGRHGNVFDLYAGPANGFNGDSYPNDATRQWMQFGHLIFPWNGSKPLIA